jgi:hypothetical protein
MRERSGGLRIGSMGTSLPPRFSPVETLEHDVAYRKPKRRFKAVLIRGVV